MPQVTAAMTANICGVGVRGRWVETPERVIGRQRVRPRNVEPPYPRSRLIGAATRSSRTTIALADVDEEDLPGRSGRCPGRRTARRSRACGARRSRRSRSRRAGRRARPSLDEFDPGDSTCLEAADRADGHAEGQGTAGDLGPDRRGRTLSPSWRRQEDRPVHRVDRARPLAEAHPRRFPFGLLVAVLDLPADVGVQVPGEAEHIAHHLVGDHVAEQPPHVGHDARVLDQGREHVVLQAGRERLDPAEPVGPLEHLGRDLAEEPVGPRHRRDRIGRSRRVDHHRPRRGPMEGMQAVGLDGGMDDELHDAVPVRSGQWSVVSGQWSVASGQWSVRIAGGEHAVARIPLPSPLTTGHRPP